jgi:hypothetical protein
VTQNIKMINLTDRQRIELSLPAYLLYALTGAPSVFIPANPELAGRAETDIAALRDDLRVACLEPLADLPQSKSQALIRRLERIKRQVTVEWHERPALELMLMLWYFLTDLIERDVLILWEDSAMDRATRKLLPMCGHTLEEQRIEALARELASTLLTRLQAEGLYR